jgi:DedD protein
MRLPFMRPKDDPAAPRGRPGAAPLGDDALVQAARTRARQRLVGALVLLAVGVIGFPLLFDTQPRPMSPDVPIEVMRPDSSAAPRATQSAPLKPIPLNLPPADAGVETASGAAVVVAAASAPSAAARATPPAPAAQSAVAPVVVGAAPRVAASAAGKASAPAPRAAAASAVAAVVRPVAASAPRPGALAVAAPAVPAASAATGPGRFVVQAGAYTDAAKLREARQKVEKLGLKTYTQVIDTEAGKRTRVRVGPFTTRQEADAVAAKVKSAGLQANVLTL